METTAHPNPVLPYTQLRPRQPKRLNLRLIIFLAAVSAIPLLLVAGYINYELRAGIQHSGNLDIVDLKALGFFPFDQQNGTINEVPHKWRALDGKRVQLEG